MQFENVTRIARVNILLKIIIRIWIYINEINWLLNIGRNKGSLRLYHYYVPETNSRQCSMHKEICPKTKGEKNDIMKVDKVTA